MNDLLFYTLLALLAYYFLVYLPSQKPTCPVPNFSSKSTQTEPLPESSPHQTTQEKQALLQAQTQEQKELEHSLDQLIKGMDDLNKDLDK